jgi:hypothetical protein
MNFRKKTKCTIGLATNPEIIQFSFHGDNWGFFFPDVKGILAKGLKPCHWADKSEGMTTYSIATDEYHDTLQCEDGEVHVIDDSYGLLLCIEKKNAELLSRVEKVLQASGRFEIESNLKE